MNETKTETKLETLSKRRRFSEEFKEDAVRLVVSEEYSFKAAATAVGVSEQTLRHWHARLAPPPAECGEHATLEHTYYNQSAAARLLGVSRQALIRKIQRHRISLPRNPR